MKYLTVMGARSLRTPFSLYYINPVSIIYLKDMGTYTVNMMPNTEIDSPICEVALASGYLYVSGVAEELIARMS